VYTCKMTLLQSYPFAVMKKIHTQVLVYKVKRVVRVQASIIFGIVPKMLRQSSYKHTVSNSKGLRKKVNII